jgi:hypothetical protein
MKCCASTGRNKKADYQEDWSTEEKGELVLLIQTLLIQIRILLFTLIQI